MERTVLRLLFAVAVFCLLLSPLPATRSCRAGTVHLRPLPRSRSVPHLYMPHRLHPRRCYLPYCAYHKAVRYLKRHWSEFANRRFMTIIDYTQPSTRKRLFLIDMYSGDVTRFLVSHGKNSGELYARRFSNRPDSYESPRGFFMTGPEYYGTRGPSMLLYGLQKGINDNSLAREIVMHGAAYVSWGAIELNRRLHGLARLGLSEGCPAIPIQAAQDIIEKIRDGSLLYMYAGPAAR